MRKGADGAVLVVHALQYPGALKIVHRLPEAGAVFAGKDQLRLPLLRHTVLGALIYVAIGVTGDGDGLFPVLHNGLDGIDHDGRAEHRSVQNGADGAVGALPHLMELILLHPLLVRRDGRALDADAQALDGLACLHRDPVAGLVAFLQAQIVVLGLEIDKGREQFVLNHLPDDAGHFVAVHFHKGRRHLNSLIHAFLLK